MKLMAGFETHLPYYYLQIISFLLWQAATVQKLNGLLQVTKVVADRKCSEWVEFARKIQLQIAMVATVETLLRTLKCSELLLRKRIMVILPQKANFELGVLPFLQIH
jgi:hypothetical protein